MNASSPKLMPAVQATRRAMPSCVGMVTMAALEVITNSSPEECPAATMACPR
jgi:hypothetical protein